MPYQKRSPRLKINYKKPTEKCYTWNSTNPDVKQEKEPMNMTTNWIIIGAIILVTAGLVVYVLENINKC